MAKEKTVFEMLNEYHENTITRKLREKYLTPSLFHIIRKERSEEVHSNFLKWLFELQNSLGNEDFNIISSLLRVSYTRAREQNLPDFPASLIKLAYGSGSSIRLVEVEREYSCSGAGSVDLVISGEASDGSDRIPFKIIIENKVDSKEHHSQTCKYYNYFEGHRYRGARGEQRLYLFLTPEFNAADAECECGHFIKINYRDIMNYCIHPLKTVSGLSPKNRLFLDEYSRALSFPSYINNDYKTIIMSLDPDDEVLLNEFWKANKDLIKMSLEAYKASGCGGDEEEQEDVQKAIDAIKNIGSSSKKQFKITNKDTGAFTITNQMHLMEQLMDLYNKHSSLDGKDIVAKYNRIGSVFVESAKTGYSDWFTFKDSTRKRITTQQQRDSSKLEKIIKMADEDGFIIERL